MIREHEVLASSMEAVVDNLDQLLKKAVEEKWTAEQIIDAVDHYRASLKRIAGCIK